MANSLICETCGNEFEHNGTRGPKPKNCPDCNSQGTQITKAMYGWTKYGGAREGLVKKELEKWYCQVCGAQMPKSIPAYMIPMDRLNRDFLRVCPECQNASYTLKITTYAQLVRVIKR